MEDQETACAMSQHWTKSSMIFSKERTRETTSHMLGTGTEQKLVFSPQLPLSRSHQLLLTPSELCDRLVCTAP